MESAIIRTVARCQKALQGGGQSNCRTLAGLTLRFLSAGIKPHLSQPLALQVWVWEEDKCLTPLVQGSVRNSATVEVPAQPCTLHSLIPILCLVQ